MTIKSRVEETIETKLGRFEEKLDNLKASIDEIKQLQKENYVTKSEHLAIVARVAETEDSIKWISRLVIGTVITAVIGFFLVKK
jgi:F0F1-type ATP synthase assembly protein I